METDYRISGRISTFATVSYSSFDDDEQCTISGMIVDVNDAGLGIYTNTPVADDTIIAVCCTDLWDEVEAATTKRYRVLNK